MENNKLAYKLYGYRIQHARKQKELAMQQGIDIYKSALERLNGDGFIIEEKGSQYIAKLIECLYLERELLKKYANRPSYEGYWDLNDPQNPHYYQLGDAKEIQEEMRKSIINSSCEDNDADFNELIYDLSDLEIFRNNYYRQDDPEYHGSKAISYIRILKPNNN